MPLFAMATHSPRCRSKPDRPRLLAALLLTLPGLSCSRSDNGEPPAPAPESPVGAATVGVAHEQPHPGEALYLDHCASCHGQVTYKAPSWLFISMLGPVNILESMNGGLTAADVPGLELKWTFAYPHTTKARSQPTYGGGEIYFGSQDGTVRALEAKTGCLRWAFRASAEVRTAIVISPWSADDADADPTLYFDDLLVRAYAISARTGDLRWAVRVDDHRDASITGSPALADSRLYVPVSSLEVVSAADPGYACCTFRGSAVTLDAVSGEQIWKSYSIDRKPENAGTNRAGTAILAPSGAPIWNTPAIDLERGWLYAGTGENYSSAADGNSDAIIAFDLETGAKIWVSQKTAGGACLSDLTSDDANCPEENGADYDFGASPMLVTLPDGRDVVIGGQKSGTLMAIDPASGETLWKTQVGRGGVLGGIHFDMAADGARIYVQINDMVYPEDLTRYEYTTSPMACCT